MKSDEWGSDEGVHGAEVKRDDLVMSQGFYVPPPGSSR